MIIAIIQIVYIRNALSGKKPITSKINANSDFSSENFNMLSKTEKNICYNKDTSNIENANDTSNISHDNYNKNSKDHKISTIEMENKNNNSDKIERNPFLTEVV